MTTPMAKAGRNDLCPCGSGRKFKRCCGAVDLAKEDPASRFFGVAAAAAALMLVGGLLVWTKALVFDDAAQATKVWSPEHGHYHTVGGETASGGLGKVWSEEHGHYHDAAPPAPPVAAETPVRGALDGLRSAELDEAGERVVPGGASH